MHAVIATGGKQYRVQEGDLVDIEKLATETGEVVFSEILSIGDGAEIKFGSPNVEGAAVKAEIVKHFRAKKLLVFKMKRRKGYRKRKGHRQNMTQVKITEVLAS